MSDEFRGRIDDPAAGSDVQGLTRVAGWAVSPGGPNVAAEAQVDDLPSQPLVVGRPRPDVAAVSPEQWASSAGFLGALDVDTGRHRGKAGPIRLVVRVTDNRGSVNELAQTILLEERQDAAGSPRWLDEDLGAWLNTPIVEGRTPPFLTLGACQAALGLVRYTGAWADLATRRVELADRLLGLWQRHGDDAIPESVLQGVWVPTDDRRAPRLPDGWIDSWWGERLARWLNDDVDASGPEEPPFSWFGSFVYFARPAVRRRFPDPLGAERAPYARWLATEGAEELGIPSSLLDSVNDWVGAHAPPRGLRSPRRHVGPRLLRRAAPGTAELALRSPGWPEPDAFASLRRQWPRRVTASGVNVVGQLAADSGAGEATRSTLRSLRAGGWETRTFDLGARENSGDQLEREDRDRGGWFDVTVTNTHVLFGGETLAAMGRRFVLDRHNIGFWYWELAELPPALAPTLDYVDELWVATRFTAEALQPHTSAPVTVVPVSVDVELRGDPPGRERFGLPTGRFLFLTLASADSLFDRKNPAGVVEAFVKAFEGSDKAEVGLVVKTRGLSHAPQLRAALESAAAGHPIYLIDETLDRSDTLGLLSCVDAFVSLHRAEGFGLPIAEAMALGKPVIVTGYSGNTDFCMLSTSLLVDYTLSEVGDGQGVYPPDMVWADPDTDDAAAKMHLVWSDDALRRRVARAGQEEIRQRYSDEAAASVIRPRLEVIG